MDDVCITFHVIANSSVRKKKTKPDKQNQNSAWSSPGMQAVSWEQLGSTAHAFPRLGTHVGIRAVEDTILCWILVSEKQLLERIVSTFPYFF